MKRQDGTAQMMGQIVEPIRESSTGEPSKEKPSTEDQSTEDQSTQYQSAELQSTQYQSTQYQSTEDKIAKDSRQKEQTQPRSRYRIDRLVGQEVGKRTFLATDLNSYNRVVLKLVLFCPDLTVEEKEQTVIQQESTLGNYELPACFPYLESFEAETALGAGLILVKPYVETHQALRQHRRRASYAPFSRNSDIASKQHVRPPSKNHRSPRPQSYSPAHNAQRAYGAFKVRSTQQKLEVQFPAIRVREGLKPLGSESSETKLTPTQKAELYLSVILCTVVFVGGTVIATGSILASVAVAALLPLFFQKRSNPHDTQRVATLRLTSESDGRTILSLTTMLPPVKDRRGQPNGSPRESTLHGSRLSVKSVKISSTFALSLGQNPFQNPFQNPLKAELSFTFHNLNTRTERIRIIGSYQEIRWLSQYLAQWSNQRDPD
ncbi:MAG: hypothetical protein ACFB16_06250 [Phormidesmis sp.]